MFLKSSPVAPSQVDDGVQDEVEASFPSLEQRDGAAVAHFKHKHLLPPSGWNGIECSLQLFQHVYGNDPAGICHPFFPQPDTGWLYFSTVPDPAP